MKKKKITHQFHDYYCLLELLLHNRALHQPSLLLIASLGQRQYQNRCFHNEMNQISVGFAHGYLQNLNIDNNLIFLIRIKQKSTYYTIPTQLKPVRVDAMRFLR